MKLILTSMVVLLLTVSCKFGCEVEKVTSTIVTNAIVNQLHCTNSAAVLEDVTALVHKTGICDLTEDKFKEGLVADIVCPLLGSLLLDWTKNQIPADWKCQPTGDLINIAVMACRTIPFKP